MSDYLLLKLRIREDCYLSSESDTGKLGQISLIDKTVAKVN